MNKQVRGRKPVRSNVSKVAKEVDDEVAKDVPDLDKLQVLKVKLEEAAVKLADYDEKILEKMLDSGADEDLYDKEAEEIEEYADKVRVAKYKLKKTLEPKAPQKKSSKGVEKSNLPPISLPSFDGDIKNWLNFWSHFQKIHNDDRVPECDKFYYLLDSMAEGTRAWKLVNSYPQTSENYVKVIAALQDRYGDKTLLAEVYVRELLKFVNTNLGKSVPLSSIYDELESHLRSLETLGVTASQSAIFLYPMVESSLPLEIIKVWQRSSLSGYGPPEEDSKEITPEDRLKRLMKFLRQEVKGEERLNYVSEGMSKGKSGRKKDKEKSSEVNDDIPTVAGLFVGERSKCIFCDGGHESFKCRKATTMTFEQKNSSVREKRCCFLCLRKGHSSKDCKSKYKCTQCGMRHALLLCRDQSSVKSSERATSSSSDRVENVPANLACSAEAVLKTLMVTVVGPKGRKTVRALLDDGAHKSYIDNEVAEEIGLKVLELKQIQHTLFGGVQTPIETLKRVKVNLVAVDGRHHEFEVLGRDVICGDIARVPRGAWMKKLKEKRIFVNDIGNESPPIQLLLGAIPVAALKTGRMERITSGLVAYETHIGWVLMGASPVECKSQSSINLAMTVTCMHVAESSMEQLWNLDTIGIRDPAEKLSKKETEEAVLQHFLKTVSRSPDGRYRVALPWIGGRQVLPDNRLAAERRLESATRKLFQLQKYEAYEDVFNKWLEEGIIEEVKGEDFKKPAYYLPHRAVLKPESLTTPIRPVFDASSKCGRSPSLNECLEKGPNLLDLLPDLILRFRIGKVGVISDIRKAFLMIDLDEEDKNYMRFLWWKNNEAKEYKVFRHNRVVFGVNCSPFLLGAVIEYHLSNVNEEEKPVAELLRKSLYVDNCVLSLNSFEEYEYFRRVSTRIMAEAKMELRLWQCSSGEESGVGSLTSSGCGLETGRRVTDESRSTSVLGLKWNLDSDTLGVDLGCVDMSNKITKRLILSTVQKVFDPMGIVCPALLPPKLMVQESWKTKTKWDDELSEEQSKKFKKWIEDLDQLREVRIPRNVTSFEDDRSKWQLHMFCDASMVAYAACVFLRVEGVHGVSVQLLQAKSRVAPVKPVTVPRLELLGCTIGARLLDSVSKALSLVGVPVILWSDSSTALSWIKRNDLWGTFVGNRVREILSLTQPENWRHVPGVMNPADLPSRGCTASELLSSRWWEGPKWLRLPREKWPSEKYVVNEEEVLAERKKTVVKCVVANVLGNEVYYAPTSSYYKNVRILAYVRRFINACRKKKVIGYLTVREIRDAEEIILGQVQAECFPEDSKSRGGLLTELDERGLLRVTSKLLNLKDSLDFRRPLLLPHKHPIVDMMIRETHETNCHAGVQFVLAQIRERFWIVQGRKAVRRVIQNCVTCRRFTVKKPEVVPSALPENRVKATCAFETVGVDLAGPLPIRKKKKAWIVLFTCAVYRCVHLEVVKNLTTEAFLEAFNRFMSRRGRPCTVYSDNGTNFVGSNNLFIQLDWEKITRDCGMKRIQWIFNPPSAAWWGGFWERLIGSTKNLLRRVLGKTSLTYDKLRNHLCNVESVINGRPLTTVTEDPNDLRPLTPAMFLHELLCPTTLDLELLDASGFQRLFVERKRVSDELKMRFRREYLAHLVQRGKEKHRTPLEVGDVVLIASDNKKRWEWPMAKVIQVYPGKDGNVRVAKVRTAKQTLIRPAQRLYPMEVSSPRKFGLKTSPAPEVEETMERDSSTVGDREDSTSRGKKKNSTARREKDSHAGEKETHKEIVLRTGRAVKVPVKY